MALHRTARTSARLCSFAIVLSTLIAGPVAHAAPTYHLIDLGPNTTAVVYWDGSGPMIDLNSLLDKPNRLHLVDAMAMNEDGWIAANAVYFDTYHGVLLKPVLTPRANQYL